MKRTPRLLALVLPFLAACADGNPLEPVPPPAMAVAGSTINVTTNANDGAGSLREAIEAANNDATIGNIVIAPGIGTIALASTLTYTGDQALCIDGQGATIDGSAGFGDAFHAVGGGDLVFLNLTVEDASGHGILIEVPADRTGEQSLTLDHVTLQNNSLTGFYFDDQLGGEPASVGGAESTGNPGGGDSDASLRVSILFTTISGNGLSAGLWDYDGGRVDEGGVGSAYVYIHRSNIRFNQGDGIEVDETGPGDVNLTAEHSDFSDNGEQIEFPDDTEDGLDIDEAGEGDIRSSLVDITVNRNQDEGVDYDEAGDGSIHVTSNGISAALNADDNVKFSEEDDGDIEFQFNNLYSVDSEDGDGVAVDEEDAGNVRGRFVNSFLANNDSDDIQVEQLGAGSGELRLQKTVSDPPDLTGVQLVTVPKN